MASNEEQQSQPPPPPPAETDHQSNPPTSEAPTSEAPSLINLPLRPAVPERATSELSPPISSTPMTASSTPLGNLNAARKAQTSSIGGGAAAAMNPAFAAKMKEFHLSRSGAAVNRGPPTPGVTGLAGPIFPAVNRIPPPLKSVASSPVVAGPSKMKRKGPGLKISDIGGGAGGDAGPPKTQTNMEKYAEFLDPKTGALIFKGKARLHSGGVEFSSGRTFSISLDEVDTMDELGKGNYGTVYKVRHARPKYRKPGLGLAGILKATKPAEDEVPPSPTRTPADSRPGGTDTVMAMKEMRLELDDAKFASIIMELDILHRCISPFIVDFYGAFFQEGAVYICMEWMDGGSLDKLYGNGIPEGVLRKITYAAVMGLKSLKEEHNIIHRDVKPTNILINSKGLIKICDFGVSGNLVASIAKTNIGCQSYMAPERINSSGVPGSGAGAGIGTYSVQSDIWSLGLTIIECAIGRYPYPPETYNNIFSQLAAIVEGEPPDLPADSFSDAAHDFVAGCLNKIPNLRPTYPMLLQHAWLAPLAKPETIAEEDEEAAEAADAAGENLESPATGSTGIDADGFADREVGEWVIKALDEKKRGLMKKSEKPALHAAPLDAALNSPSAVPREAAV